MTEATIRELSDAHIAKLYEQCQCTNERLGSEIVTGVFKSRDLSVLGFNMMHCAMQQIKTTRHIKPEQVLKISSDLLLSANNNPLFQQSYVELLPFVNHTLNATDIDRFNRANDESDFTSDYQAFLPLFDKVALPVTDKALLMFVIGQALTNLFLKSLSGNDIDSINRDIDQNWLQRIEPEMLGD
ncbi:hypothetical protein L1D14_03925 [Vibrio tubiashii]|uniref:hypothetical protein n=1 Tax=Vibrio tubiashii TaxID=29498 RepID=UPI001EFCFB87|nr:hypothetical protein [Vibrio tubiashii]MCG9575379.1 hypothetical protein [Vibrio tubiashii]